VGWDIEIMTASELEEQIERAIGSYMELEGMTEDLAQRLVEQGYLSYDDLSLIEPDYLMEMGGISAEQVELIVEQADQRVEEAEKLAEEQKLQKRQAEHAVSRSGIPAEDVAASSAGSSENQAVEDGNASEAIDVSDSQASELNEGSEVLGQSQSSGNDFEETMDPNDDSVQK